MLAADSVLIVLTSHLLAERRYRWGWGGPVMRQLLHFGWPLLINGLLMFGMFQGDRFIVATLYTMDDLGIYSVAFTVAILPSSIAMRVSQSLLLPALAGVREDAAKYRRIYRLVQQGLCASGAMLAVMLVVVGPNLVRLLYGQKFAAAGLIVGWLAIAQSLRLLRMGPTVAALSLGDSRNALIANVFRMLGLPLALAAALMGGSLAQVAATGIAGEIVALASCVWVAQHRHRLAAGDFLRPAVCAVAGMVAASALVMGFGLIGWSSTLALCGGITFLLAGSMLVSFPELRSAVAHFRHTS